ncbi:uncharacterized protein LOC129737891 [Uranotaenia lowii]|uniref:uncharacterized protein LOC129737891 n=1 Tax=Uranotaenia lowii TaxID=190385 RepID=UPI00247A8D40|nr:uncharacterized protein LOC129737891 [Uranotaenia lowii]
MRIPRSQLTFYDPETCIWTGIEKVPPYDATQSLGQLILDSLAKNPLKITQISADSHREVTCQELRLQTIRIAQNLSLEGIQPGDVVTMAANNGELVAPVTFACLALGVPLNTLDPGFDRDDLAHMLATVRPKAVFCDREGLGEMVAAIEMVGLNPLLVTFGGRVDGMLSVTDFLKPTGREEWFSPIRFREASQQVALIVCSSGTSGRSKGVCLSHAQCIGTLCGFGDCRSDDVLLCFSSLYWISGIFILLNGTVAGATRIITREPFHYRAALDIINRYRVTFWFLQPALALQILKNISPGTGSLPSLRLCVSGGAAVSPELKLAFETLAPNANFMPSYGLSEAGGPVTGCEKLLYKNGSTGYVKPNVSVKIVNDEGEALPIGQQGEILVKPEFPFLGYYKNLEATAEILDPEGWLHTGDIGCFDRDGFFYITDRKKDIIRYHGVQISPSELESVIQKLDEVVGVCVVAIPGTGIDLPAALIVKKAFSQLTVEQIEEFTERNLPHYKQLKGGIYLVDELPMTPSGKIVRRKCREIVLELLQERSTGTLI